MICVETIDSEILDTEREILVYLPPGYQDEPDARYPVLYMQDGQNIFHEHGGEAARWNVDLTADRLIGKGQLEPLIIVGIANSEWRDHEYTPTLDPEEGAGGAADEYLGFLLQEVKPHVDSSYRVQPFRETTGIGGSSLGGLLALYAGMQHPEMFSKIAALSPSLWWDRRVILRMAQDWQVDPDSVKIWLDMGHYEGEDEEEDEAEGDDAEDQAHPVEEARALHAILKAKGLRRGRQLRYFEDRQGVHHESAWGTRMGRVLKFLYGRPGR